MDRFKFRVFDKNINKYLLPYNYRIVIGMNGELLRINSNKTIDSLPLCDYVIEKCTGLKDKNDNLIFEGDELIGKPDSEGNRCIHIIDWDEEEARFCLYLKGNKDYGIMRISQEWLDLTKKEIISTIHNNEGE